jgi:acyl dehydratase
MTALLTDEVRAFIGREVTFTAPDEVGRAAIRYFALAIGDDNPVYTDDEAARAAGHPGVIAPPTMICESNQFLAAPRDEDGFPGHMWELPIPNCRLVRGGNEYAFVRPVLPTDIVTTMHRIAEITERTSASGQPMLLVVNEITYADQRGERLATNRETLIYLPRGVG